MNSTLLSLYNNMYKIQVEKLSFKRYDKNVSSNLITVKITSTCCRKLRAIVQSRLHSSSCMIVDFSEKTKSSLVRSVSRFYVYKSLCCVFTKKFNLYT